MTNALRTIGVAVDAALGRPARALLVSDGGSWLRASNTGKRGAPAAGGGNGPLAPCNYASFSSLSGVKARRPQFGIA
jgi:hypothetical protein